MEGKTKRAAFTAQKGSGGKPEVPSDKPKTNNNSGSGSILDLGAINLKASRDSIKEYIVTKRATLVERAKETAGKYRYIGLDLGLLLRVLISRSENKVVDESFMNDVVDMCTLFCERGSRLNDKTARMSQDGLNKRNVLVAKYQIATTGSGQPGPNTITLARIAIVFPDIVFTIMESGVGRDFNKDGEFDDIPRGLRWTSAPALIPAGWTNLYSAWVEWNENFIDITKGDMNDEALIAVKNKSLEYALISWKSDWISQENRIALMATVSLKGDISDT